MDILKSRDICRDMHRDELLMLYGKIRDEIEKRLSEFHGLWEKGDERELYAEMVFCLLTPQSRAEICWEAVECMKWRILFEGSEEEILSCLRGVRFKYTKAKRVTGLRKLFLRDGEPQVRKILTSFDSPYAAREWLVKNIDGYGYKEASHFLRNIGMGDELAILDRHIMRNLEKIGVIDAVPRALTRKKYLKIEEKMREFAGETGVPMSALDLLFWYSETGRIFK